MDKAEITQIAGAILAIWGIGLIYLPLGFIAAGACLILGPLFYDKEDEVDVQTKQTA